MSFLSLHIHQHKRSKWRSFMFSQDTIQIKTHYLFDAHSLHTYHHNLICFKLIFFVSFRSIKVYNSIWKRSILDSSSLTSVACLKRSICWALNLRMCKSELCMYASFVAYLSCFTLFSKKNVIRSFYDYDRITILFSLTAWILDTETLVRY
jgi:DNA integrity scanning protein DisA with diadenylate cyclase activity